jgi:hypothetical protein
MSRWRSTAIAGPSGGAIGVAPDTPVRGDAPGRSTTGARRPPRREEFRRRAASGQRQAAKAPATRVRDQSTRARQVAINLERLRWLPARAGRRVWVNTASASSCCIAPTCPPSAGSLSANRQQTPEVQATINSVLFNPPWNGPARSRRKIYPKLNQDPLQRSTT